MKKWHNIGLFKDERTAKSLASQFFEDEKYEAHFSDACNFGYNSESEYIEKIMLRVNYNYWMNKSIERRWGYKNYMNTKTGNFGKNVDFSYKGKLIKYVDTMGLNSPDNKGCHINLSLYYEQYMAKNKMFSTVLEAYKWVKTKGRNKMTYLIALDNGKNSSTWDYAVNEYGEEREFNSYEEAQEELIDRNYDGTVIGI